MLIVVGNENQRADILSILKQVGNSLEIRELPSGIALLKLVMRDSLKPTLIIIPWRLEAGIDGFETLKALREKGYNTSVCLVVVDLDAHRQALVAAESNASLVDWKHLQQEFPNLLTSKPSE